MGHASLVAGISHILFPVVFRCQCLVMAPTSRVTGTTTGRRIAMLEPSGGPVSTTRSSKRRSSISLPRRARSVCTCDITADSQTDGLTAGLTDQETDLQTDRPPKWPSDHWTDPQTCRHLTGRSPLYIWDQDPASSGKFQLKVRFFGSPNVSWIWTVDGSRDRNIFGDVDRSSASDIQACRAETFFHIWITCGQMISIFLFSSGTVHCWIRQTVLPSATARINHRMCSEREINHRLYIFY